MNVRRYVLISLAIVAAMFLVAAWAWPQLPPGGQIPIHWDAAGNPNGYASKAVALLLVPLLSLGLTALFAVIPRIEPRRSNLSRSSRAYGVTWLAIIALMLFIQIVTTLVVLGYDLSIRSLALGGTGVLFIVMGNYLGKVRSNFMFGIRTPWTLTSELSWNRTHRLGGRLFVILGSAVVVATLLGQQGLEVAVLIIGLIVVIATLFIYSYRVWRDDPDRRPIGGETDQSA